MAVETSHNTICRQLGNKVKLHIANVHRISLERNEKKNACQNPLQNFNSSFTFMFITNMLNSICVEKPWTVE